MSVRLLPDSLIDIIAAGEVVDKPANVVKELVENSLDAGADEITIDVRDGGRTLIMVVDNGVGMYRSDLEKSILRHATSKLPTDDLLDIKFMGFRGEALPSIASVSGMSIETNGLFMDANSGRIIPSPHESGTCVKVKNLFQNVPARLKFLRSDRSEMMSVSEIVFRLALARPDVSFIYNNKLRLGKEDDALARFEIIAGQDCRGKMVQICETDGEIKISGFVSTPILRRASSIHQYLFVNRRPVRDKVLAGALRAAYFDVMHAREYPLCCLYLDIPSHMVDVNVSPSKTDVRFLEPSRIRDLMVRAIRSKIGESHSKQDSGFGFQRSGLQDVGCVQPHLDLEVNNTTFQIGDFESPQVPVGNQLSLPLGFARAQIGSKYILAESNNGLIIIDQHAAHERIVYEKLKKGGVLRQQLLIPHVLHMTDDDVAAVLDVRSDLEDSGLVVERFGETDIAIYEKPADWDMDWPECLKSVAAQVRAGGTGNSLKEALHAKLATYACHHSVRAGQKLSLEQMNALLRQIEETERGGFCNHGRPVWKTFSFDELDSEFER